MASTWSAHRGETELTALTPTVSVDPTVCLVLPQVRDDPTSRIVPWCPGNSASGVCT